MGYYAKNPYENPEPPRCLSCDEFMEKMGLGISFRWECHNPACEECPPKYQVIECSTCGEEYTYGEFCRNCTDGAYYDKEQILYPIVCDNCQSPNLITRSPVYDSELDRITSEEFECTDCHNKWLVEYKGGLAERDILLSKTTRPFFFVAQHLAQRKELQIMYQVGEKIVIKNNAFKGSDDASDFEWRGKEAEVIAELGDNCYEVYVEGKGNCLLIASEMKRANKACTGRKASVRRKSSKSVRALRQ